MNSEFNSGMQRDTNINKVRYDLIMPKDVPLNAQMLHRLAVRMTNGAIKYGERNWELAYSMMELERFKESCFRHFMQAMSGDNSEDHWSAVMFNILGINLVEYKLNNKGNL